MLLLACASSPVSGSLEVLSYNVHGLPPEITGDDTTGRMEQIAPLLGAFDLLGVQEDWMEDNHAILAAAVDLPTYARYNDAPEGKAYGAGLSSWASLDEVDRLEQTYAACNGYSDGAGDCFAGKGFVALRLAVGESAFDFYNSHLEAGSGDEDIAARAEHVDELIAAMNGWSEGRAVLFVGDTNLSGDDPVDAAEVARWEDATGVENACTIVGCPEPERIDRLMLRSAGDVTLTAKDWRVEAEFVDDEGVPFSDHDAIGVTMDYAER